MVFFVHSNGQVNYAADERRAPSEERQRADLVFEVEDGEVRVLKNRWGRHLQDVTGRHGR